eukprot:TRINITY_DN60_c0_g1_i3.p1 TRINITY_DN60_c0_g1~~TRINITY_DN60_c0_g1_i3.p1  ORF type:complete len:268 (-),score=45.29 TRINITY_DN60_c0_g1_i3:432-1235(-)
MEQQDVREVLLQPAPPSPMITVDQQQFDSLSPSIHHIPFAQGAEQVEDMWRADHDHSEECDCSKDVTDRDEEMDLDSIWFAHHRESNSPHSSDISTIQQKRQSALEDSTTWQAQPQEWHQGSCPQSPLCRTPQFQPSSMTISRSSGTSLSSLHLESSPSSLRIEEDGEDYSMGCCSRSCNSYLPQSPVSENQCKITSWRSDDDEEMLELFLGKFDPEEDIAMMMMTGLSREDVEDFVKTRLGEAALQHHKSNASEGFDESNLRMYQK